MACNLKTAGRRAKRGEIWEFVTCIWGTIDLLVIKVILRSFGALVSKWHATGKRLAVERNGLKFATGEKLSYVYGAPLTL